MPRAFGILLKQVPSKNGIHFVTIVTETDIDNPNFVTNADLIKTIESLPSLHGKTIGKIEYTDMNIINKNMPNKKEFSPIIFPFEKLEGGVYMKYFQNKSIGLELEKIALNHLIRKFGENIVLNYSAGVSLSMKTRLARRYIITNNGMELRVPATKMAILISKAKAHVRRVRILPAKNIHRRKIK